MTYNYKWWKKLFIFSLGLFIGTVFCMKWMEGDLIQNGEKFSVIGLEVCYSKEELSTILAGLDEHVKKILRYHLSFDFVFMAGVFPGIAALCMMARCKLNRTIIRKILLLFALLQMAAWGFDILENCYLLKWIKNPVIGSEFSFFHFIVYSKWIIAISGAILATTFLIKSRKTPLKS